MQNVRYGGSLDAKLFEVTYRFVELRLNAYRVPDQLVSNDIARKMIGIESENDKGGARRTGG